MSGPARGAGRPMGAGGPGGRGRGPMGGGMGPMGHLAMPVEKPKDFRGTFRRLAGELRPERALILFVVVVAFLSTAGQVFGPKILGNGINKLMDGIVGKQMGLVLPAGTTHAQAVEILKQAHSPLADVVASTNAVPGVGIDFRTKVSGPDVIGPGESTTQARMPASPSSRSADALTGPIAENDSETPLITRPPSSRAPLGPVVPGTDLEYPCPTRFGGGIPRGPTTEDSSSLRARVERRRCTG